MVNSVSDRWVVVYDRSGRAVMRAKVDGGFRVDVETMKAGRVVERQSVWVDGATPMSQPATDDVQYVGGSTIHLPNGENYNLDAIAKAADKTEALQQQVTGLAVDLRQTREKADQLETWLQRTRDELVELKDHAVVNKGGQTVLLPNGLYVDLGYLASQAKDVPALRSHLSSLSVEVSQLRQDVLALGLKTVALGELITARLGEQAGQIEAVGAAVDTLRHEAMHAHENMVDAVRVLQERVLQLEIMHTVPEPPDRT